jgi:hypothetical protein
VKTPPVVPPNTPVVTLKGVCKDRTGKTPCETVITREDWDGFVEASAPEVSKIARSRQAVQYARSLAFASLAEQQGLARAPAVAKELDAQPKIARARILANALLEKLRAQAPGVAESDVQKYYDEHRDQYEQVQVSRMSVPFEVPTDSGRPLEPKVVKGDAASGERRHAAAGRPSGR